MVTAIIVAAGKSERMGAGTDKAFLNLGPKPVVAWSLLAFERCADVDQIVLVVRKDQLIAAKAVVRMFGISKVRAVVAGGAKRQDSVMNGLKELDVDTRFVVVHDGARPLVSQQVIEAVCKAAFLYSAAGPGVPVTDTIKRIDGADHVLETVDRGALRAMQTPQMAEKPLLLAALQSALEAGAETTDELAALERMGMRPVIVPGDRENIKLTTPFDLLVGETLAHEASAE